MRNEPTFPVYIDGVTRCDGLTKREYFAGLAMQAILASGDIGFNRSVSLEACVYADALIAELNKPTNSKIETTSADVLAKEKS